MAQIWGCEPQTYVDWSDPTGRSIGCRYPHLRNHVLQTTLNMLQCKGGVRDEIMMECFSISSGRAERITMMTNEVRFRIESGPLFFRRNLFLVGVHFAVGAALLRQLEGWPNLPALDALRSKFLRGSSYPPASSVRLLAHPFPEEGDA